MAEPAGLTFGPNSSIRGILSRSGGKSLVWGTFTNVNGTPQRGLVQLLATGAVDDTFAPALDGNVTGVLAYDSERLLIWGDFTSVNGIPCQRIARLEADASLDGGFHAVINGSINGVVPSGDGALIVWGEFSTVNGAARIRLAELASDGSLDTGFNNGPGPDRPLSGVRVLSNGNLIVWGAFNRFNGFLSRRLVRLNADGLPAFIDPALTSIASLSGNLQDVLADERGGAIFALNNPVCGVNGCPNLMYMRADGTADLNMPAFGGEDASGRTRYPLHQAALDSQGRLLVVGEFSNINGQARFSVARFFRAPVLEMPRFEPETGFRANLIGHPGQTYGVERSTNLFDWVAVGIVTNRQVREEFLDPTSAAPPATFYRALLLAP
jgi:hypothetical protein